MSAPSVSIIVPTYDRPARLAACLAALARQEPPGGGLEVIVVDDGSPSPAAVVAAPFERQLNLRLLRQPNAGPAAARNAGAAWAAGALLVFTDDDCQPEPGWARTLADAHALAPDHLLGGRTLNALPDNAFSSASQLLIDYLYEYFGPESGRVPLVASNNLALPADAFRALGGFDETFPLAAGEDRDLCARWHEAGRPFGHVPDAVVLHAHALGLRSFWRQHVGYGRGARYYHHLRPDSAGPDPEPLAFYTDLVRYPLRHAAGARAWRLVALMAVSQVANALGYATTTRPS
ncbi:glycosyltransferase [Rubrivirga sp. IMCC43871]|uniref:glycosyltransferase n=1 Tax=Rubrivirga sp. IMCC43871 TaxID=3391575 RepID=UPI00398F8F94